jgi:hypothetical protein
VKSWGDELARQVDMRIHAAVPDLPGLDAILPDDRPDGIVCTVAADQSQWQFLLGSTAAASASVRVPADQPAEGRWLLCGASVAQNPGGGAALLAMTLAATVFVAQFAALAAGVKSASVPLGDVLPAGARPFVRELTLITAFSGGGATAVTMDLGGTVPNDIVADQSLFTGAPAAMAGANGVNPTGDHGSEQLHVTITADVDLNKLTAGSVAVAFCYVILP